MEMLRRRREVVPHPVEDSAHQQDRIVRGHLYLRERMDMDMQGGEIGGLKVVDLAPEGLQFHQESGGGETYRLVEDL
jgi:hypothetical protein